MRLDVCYASGTHMISRLIVRTDYSLSNPDTLTKYKTAAQISHKVLDAVTGISDLGHKSLR